jgi:ABC-type thiamin/hydroxymethylpyrimidine transport system permease subunit
VLAPMLWLASMILGGWVASLVAGGRRFLLGYLSAAMGMLVVVLVMRLVLHIAAPLLATVAGVVIVSALGALGALTWSRKAK